ncbi:MAG: PAS domain S-box protein [Desulfobacterales bacterium]
MYNSFFENKTAIVGAGNFCVRFLEHFFLGPHGGTKPEIIGVADKDPSAPGISLAHAFGFPTTTDYREFAAMEGLEVILEMSNDPTLVDEIAGHMPDHIRVIDHYKTRSLFDLLLIREFRDEGLKRIQNEGWSSTEIKKFFDCLMDRFARILEGRNKRSRQIVRDLWEQEETVSQIIQGSTIPTFVINRDHKVTHWNKALERLTGVSADEMIGTNRQWFPFYSDVRPSLADLLLDQIDIHDIGNHYGAGWNPSNLIDGAYQAEGFFENIGEGKWLFFTAAPIKSRNGKIIGAIETFWDTTEDKRLAEEQAQYTRELSTLLDLYTSLSAPASFEERLNEAFRVIVDFMDAVNVCIFLRQAPDSYEMRYGYGEYPGGSGKDVGHIAKTVDKDRLIIIDRRETGIPDSQPEHHDLHYRCLVYVPFSDKEKNPFGVIQIASRKPPAFTQREKDILELMGNRIGVAVENALLQEKFVQSEEKYRTLFNNDPTPIFILDSETGRITDMNHRAEDTYGYTLEEMRDRPFTALGDADDIEVISGLAEVTPEQSLLISKKRHYKKTGEPFYVTIVISAAEYRGREILIVNTTDITEIMEKEAQLIQAGKMTTLGVMAAGMAHEINQPLNVIQICADYFLKMLKKGEPVPPDELKAMTLNIAENVDRASTVIKRVRDFARQTEVVRHEIGINNPIQDSLNVVGHSLKSNGIELHLELAENLPPILADHNRLEQVFINLITNAVDAIEEKAEKYPDRQTEKVITVKSFCEKGEVGVTVSDAGAGMSDYVREKIFEPFFTTKKTGKGTGLGVSISYGIVKDYDGKIEVNSEVDKGTTFKVTFPHAGITGKECR